MNPNINSDSRFLTALYSDLLARPADPAGLALWAGQLAGRARQQVAASFISSQEYFARGRR